MVAVCKHDAMTSLRVHLEQSRTPQSQLAAALGISRGYMSELVGGTKTPSLELAFAIEEATGGAVPARSWLPDAAPADAGEAA